MKRRFFLMIGIAAVCIAAIALYFGFQQRHLLPLWIQWNHVTIREDSLPQISLENRTVTVQQDGSILWQSGDDIRVQDILTCDIDHDSQQELLLLCWKRGRYGDNRPFWVTEDERNWSQHIYIYDCSTDGVTPIWMASDIGMDAAAWRFDPDQRLVITDTNGQQTAWDWISWGLSNIPLAEPPAQLTFAALGDNLIHFQIYDYAFRHFDGCFDDLFTAVKQELAQYDVTSINQETILVDQPEQYSSYPRFGTPIQVGDAIINAGFDIVTCATNHALDKGPAAIDLTVSLFEDAGVLCTGIQRTTDTDYRPYAILERNGIRCAVFNYTQFTNGIPVPSDTPYILHTLDDPQQVQADLLTGAADSDIAIVYVHWGTEYANAPDEFQLEWAQLFADCGVDVVIGTHPHVLQPWAWMTGRNGNQTLVYYSLGNFISAQTEDACKTGGLAYFTVTKENGQCRITDCGLKTLVTEVENGHYTTKLQS